MKSLGNIIQQRMHTDLILNSKKHKDSELKAAAQPSQKNPDGSDESEEKVVSPTANPKEKHPHSQSTPTPRRRMSQEQ